MVSMDDVPENVRGEVEKVILEDECVFCGTTFLDVEKTDGNRYFISKENGKVKGNHYGGIPLRDQGAVPRQVIETEPQMVCGHCNNTDIVERNASEFWGIDVMNGRKIGAFAYKGFLDNHYLSDGSFDSSNFEEAFENLASEHPDTIEVSGVTLQRSSNDLAEEIRNIIGRRPDEVSVEKLRELLEDYVDLDEMIIVKAGTYGIFLPEKAV